MNSTEQTGYSAWDSSQPQASNPCRQIKQGSNSNCPLDLGQELQKEYTIVMVLNKPSKPLLTSHLAGMGGHQHLKSITLHHLLPRKCWTGYIWGKKKILLLDRLFWTPSINPEHPLSLLWVNSFQLWLNLSKECILDVSSILRTPAHRNLNHGVENPMFLPIKPQKPQVILNLWLLRHTQHFLYFTQSGKSLLLGKKTRNYRDWYKDLANNFRR